MKIRTQQAGRPPVEMEIDSIIVFDDFEQPIAVLQRLVPGHILMVRADERDFKLALEQSGYTEQVPSVRQLET